MQALPTNLYRGSQVKILERTAIEQHNMPGATLMAHAGKSAYQLLKQCWPEARNIAVMCGVGNNAGDGYVLARAAHEAGLQVSVFQVGDRSRLQDDALNASQVMQKIGCELHNYEGQSLFDFDVVVDALLGIGINGEVKDHWHSAIEAINLSKVAVLAIDIPSGLHPDVGRAMGIAVRASVTITYIGLKQGLFTAQGPEYAGAVNFEDLDVPRAVYDTLVPSAYLMQYHHDRQHHLKPRRRSAHKGQFGHVLVIGGDNGMSGAAQMAATAAARSGAGRVSVASRARHAVLLGNQQPELMCHGVETTEELAPLLQKASVIAIGPGLGQGGWGQQLLQQVLAAPQPLILDADALNLLANKPLARGNWILTPHPGEAARLLNCSVADIETDRFHAIRELQKKYRGVIVLKGAGTLIIGENERIYICADGNPGMASGGMGDLLTGIIAGLKAQNMDPLQAAQVGTCLHGAAGDAAAIEGERGLLASDLYPHIRRLANLT
ncbi:MAG: NAD(P)H-hydrate dehydratase [Gammaproteobacteria bacterium]|nr:NAD(P)H-hydrate dehydratase [Gammaproteobacteria bacterium]